MFLLTSLVVALAAVAIAGGLNFFGAGTGLAMSAEGARTTSGPPASR